MDVVAIHNAVNMISISSSSPGEVVNVEIKQLCECPEHLDAVGLWIYEQWWRTPDNTPEVVLSLLREHTEKDTVPFTLVALEDGNPVGSCCVIENDCVHRPQYAPWVAAVFVKKEQRHRGIASRLLQEACLTARRAGITNLYVDCYVQTAPLYEKNGWQILEREVGDRDSVVMRHTIEGEQQPELYRCPAGAPKS